MADCIHPVWGKEGYKGLLCRLQHPCKVPTLHMGMGLLAEVLLTAIFRLIIDGQERAAVGEQGGEHSSR